MSRRHPHATMPETFVSLATTVLKLHDSEVNVLWHALLHSTWSRAVGLRLALVDGGVVTDDPRLAPAVVLRVIHDLEREGKLPRRPALALARAVLSETGQGDRWLVEGATNERKPL